MMFAPRYKPLTSPLIAVATVSKDGSPLSIDAAELSLSSMIMNVSLSKNDALAVIDFENNLDGVCGGGGVCGHRGGTGGGIGKTCLPKEKKVKVDQRLTTKKRLQYRGIRRSFLNNLSQGKVKLKSDLKITLREVDKGP
ncbi:hypothetical protein CQW23_02553 [Capsicum baccatum]|uniref:Uncharacterized protein n=1 Tax=Capsicum baccatum TaxID=33114 RepID=A0A2G2XRU5_CAPBA|nr:hypothetical protein CQW23_02553 [Capsicum baccatum]